MDRSGAAGVTDETLRDRSNLAKDGVVIITVTVDTDAAEAVGDIEVSARGVFSENGEVAGLQEVIQDAVDSLSSSDIRDVAAVQTLIDQLARRHLKRKIGKSPLVVATVVDV